MKKVLITGYYGFANIGDEAVLANIIEQLHKAIPGVKITVLSNTPAETAAAYKVAAINRWKPPALWRALRRTDLFILGGGSLLQDVTGKKSLSYYLGQIIMARLACRPVFLYAQGIGPISAASKKKTGFVLRRCRMITVRDEESAALLLEMKVPEKKIIVTADPVLASEVRELPPPFPSGPRLAFCLRPWPGVDAQIFARTADHFAKLGWKIIFLPFQEPRDRELAQEVAAKMTQSSYIPPENFSPQTMLASIGEMDAVVGMRLHALIMAASVSVPFVGICYDPKVESFSRQAGQLYGNHMPGCCVEEMIEDIGSMLEKREEFAAALLSKKPLWQALCKANAEIARECAFGVRDIKLENFLGQELREHKGEICQKM